MKQLQIERAKGIVAATEWSGDMRVNMNTVIDAGRVLARRLEELESILESRGAAHDGSDGTPGEGSPSH